jgi:hypothetical protein
MTVEQNALIDLLAEAVQSRIEDIRLEMYQSVDAALERVIQQAFGQHFVKDNTAVVDSTDLLSTMEPREN